MLNIMEVHETNQMIEQEKLDEMCIRDRRNTIPPDDPSGMEIAIAAVKPGTGEVLGFGLNRHYDATPEAANDATKTSQNYAVDAIDGGGSGWTIGSSWKPCLLYTSRCV